VKDGGRRERGRGPAPLQWEVKGQKVRDWSHGGKGGFYVAKEEGEGGGE